MNIGCSCVYRAPVLLDQFMPGPQVTNVKYFEDFQRKHLDLEYFREEPHRDRRTKSENPGKEEIDLPSFLNLN